ncbi:hypothetical protein D9757_005321 [Collybiopsis confluens]|uniref:P-loop containing nucleoside triphosphate hydrolase protein n=1 Tax=Collybiopsis confluens TaxID=2823264 RepID=A0A8H5M9A2_9AGAR|nr:hypothetical protein D9757_005321 [Collybiopsis confluens]
MPSWTRTVLRQVANRRYYSTDNIALRPYQEFCIQACEDALKAGSSRIGVSLPTGSGKTTCFISLLSRIPPPSKTASRALIIVNSIELARQSAEQVARLFPSWSVEIEQGVKHQASGTSDVQPERFAKFDTSCLKAVIVDEAHHAVAPSYIKLLSHFDPSIRNPDPTFKAPALPHKIPIIGFSATMSRHDGIALGSVFERIVYHRDFLSMIKEQWLCGVRFTTVQANIDLKHVTVNSRTGDFNATSLAHVINTDNVNQLVVQTWLDRAVERRSTLVFCVNIAHVQALTRVFRGFGIDARYVYAKTPSAERKALITAFKSGQFPVLINCGTLSPSHWFLEFIDPVAILTEGADIPNIDCVVVARPTRSRNVFAQMIGRGMRLSPDTGKNETPESLEEKSADQIASHTSDDIPDPTSITYTDYDDPFSFISKFSGLSASLGKLSRNAWVGCGNNVYVLECLGKGFIRIERADDETGGLFIAHYAPAAIDRTTALKLKVSPFLRSRRIVQSGDLSQVIQGCDTYAKVKVVFGPMAVGLLKSARWRKTPASEQQLKVIAKRWKKFSQDDDARLENLTKGEAANIITRLKHGAIGRHDKKLKQASRVAKEVEKERTRQAREDVQVGPL